ETVVPGQALALLNSRVSAEQSRAFAVRLLNECGDKSDKVLARAWLLAFNRPITKEEMNRSLAFLKQRESDLRAKGAPGDELIRFPNRTDRTVPGAFQRQRIHLH